jgi:hypothetical protein
VAGRPAPSRAPDRFGSRCPRVAPTRCFKPPSGRAAGRLPELTCAVRLAELEQEVRALEVRTAALKAECERTPAMATGEVLVAIQGRVERASRSRRCSRAAQASTRHGGRSDPGGVPGVHSRACRAHGSYASRVAEADGNRTRLSRDAAHTGFEDRKH